MSSPSRIFLLWSKVWNTYQGLSEGGLHGYYNRSEAEHDALLMVCDVVEVVPVVEYAIQYDLSPLYEGLPCYFLEIDEHDNVSRTATLDRATTWGTASQAILHLDFYRSGPDDRYENGKVVEIILTRTVTKIIP